MTEYLHCKACGRNFEVSEVDPDATLSELVSHARSLHFGYEWQNLVGEGRA